MNTKEVVLLKERCPRNSGSSLVGVVVCMVVDVMLSVESGSSWVVVSVCVVMVQVWGVA